MPANYRDLYKNQEFCSFFCFIEDSNTIPRDSCDRWWSARSRSWSWTPWLSNRADLRKTLRRQVWPASAALALTKWTWNTEYGMKDGIKPSIDPCFAYVSHSARPILSLEGGWFEVHGPISYPLPRPLAFYIFTNTTCLDFLWFSSWEKSSSWTPWDSERIMCFVARIPPSPMQTLTLSWSMARWRWYLWGGWDGKLSVRRQFNMPAFCYLFLE